MPAVACGIVFHSVVNGFLQRVRIAFRCFVQTKEDTIVRFSASGSTIPLDSAEVKFIWIFTGDHPHRGR